MNPAASIHRRLPGRSLTWRGLGRLWEGDDHLLESTWLLALEQYRRFFFHETKAFVVQRTKVQFIWALLQGGLATLCLLTAGIAVWIGVRNAEEEWHVALYVVAGLFGAVALFCLILLAINLLLGPSCRCHVLTATGWHALAAPARLGPALRVQTRIFPLIEAAQGQMAAAKAEAS